MKDAKSWMLRARILLMEVEKILKLIDDEEREGLHPDPQSKHEKKLKELITTGLHYANKSIELNVKKPFEDPVLQILLPSDLVQLKALNCKAKFEELSGMYAEAAKTYTLYIDEHEESRQYHIKQHYMAYLSRGKVNLA